MFNLHDRYTVGLHSHENLLPVCICHVFFAAALTEHFWLEAKYTVWTCTSQGWDMEDSKTNHLPDIFCCKNEISESRKSSCSSSITESFNLKVENPFSICLQMAFFVKSSCDTLVEILGVHSGSGKSLDVFRYGLDCTCAQFKAV